MESIIKSIFRKKTIVADYTQKIKTKTKRWSKALIGLKIEVKAASLLAGPKALLLLPLLKLLVKRKRRHLLLR